ncbi:MAG: ERF family protein [Prevotella sp.]|nr:ERF family protein [Prevotella sp.]
MTDKIVANTSKAYGYNYASLSDIANQGFTIPKMKTGTDGEKEYVYYYDAELKEWVRGAEIVVPEMKGSNSAQRYGSAITYARRYTTLLALSLACDDDKKIETQEPTDSKKAERWQGLEQDLNIKDLADEFRKLYTQEEQDRILKGLKYSRAEDIGIVDLQKYVNFKKYGKK